MRFFAALFIISMSVICGGRVFAQQNSCPPVNIGFESGTFNGWSCDTGYIDQSGNINVKSSRPINGLHTIISAGYSPALDTFGKFPTLCPFGGKYSVKLGNTQYGTHAQRMSYTFTVPVGVNDYDVTFYYAVVFQNPSHLPYQQPRFTVKTFDVTDSTYIDCASFDFIAGPSIPGFRQAPLIAPQDTEVFYKDWSPSTIHMVGLGGKQVRLEFTTNHCTFGAHFGYAYLDVDENCGPAITGNAYCAGQSSVNLIGPGGFFDYEWYPPDFSRKLANAQELTVSPPPPDGTKYALIVYPFPGLGCTDTLYTVVNKNPADFTFKVVDTLYACAGGTVDLTAPSVTAGSDKNLQFSYSPDALGQGYIYQPQRIDTSGVYYIKAVSPESCENILPVQVIIGNPRITITNPPAVYFPNTVDLSTAFTTDKNYIYKYFTDATAKIAVADYQHVGQSGTYYVQVTDRRSGCQTIAPIVVTINPPEAIELSMVTGTISTCSGTASADPFLQQFGVGGYGLTAPITATAPQGFEISLSAGNGYTTSLSLAETGGQVNTTTIYVRASATANTGSISANIILSSPGQTSKSVQVAAVVSVSPSVNQIGNYSYKNGDQTTAIDFSGTGNTYTWTNDTPAIGLPASGAGNIAPFTATNTGSSPLVAHVTVTPSSFGNAYITNYGSDDITVISTQTGQVTATITAGSKPVGIAITPDQSLVYVTNNASNTVSVIDTRANQVSATINVGQQPMGIVISPDGGMVYVVNEGDNTVSVISTQSNKVTATIKVGAGPIGIAISPDGSTLYVANEITSSVSVISTATNTVTSTITLAGYANSIIVSPDGSTLYVSISANNTVEAINLSTGKVTATIAVGNGPYGMSMSSDGQTLYVVNKISNSVSVINTRTNTVTGSVTVGNNPIGISINQDNTKLFVTNQLSNNVSEIDAKKLAVIATINVGTSPESFGAFVSTGSGCSGAPLTFTITVTPTTPVVITASGTPEPLTTIYGTPSPSTNFNVAGTALTAGILTTPPPGFEVSRDGNSYAGAVIVGTGGNIAPTKVYIRLAATTPVGDNYSGNIVLSSKGAANVNMLMPVSIVNPAPLTITADNKSRLFNTPNPALTVSYSGFVNGQDAAVLTTPPTLSTAAVSTSPPGQYTIAVSGAAAANYAIAYIGGTLTVLPPLQNLVVPNTFTPNGDGVNDTWNIKYLDAYSDCTVMVFTRYGQKVYSSVGYAIAWDGTYSGKILPTGTYYYIIDLKNNSPLLSGFVTIIH